MCACGGVGEDEGDIFGAHVPAVRAIGRSSAAFYPPGNFQFLITVRCSVTIIATFRQDGYFGKVTRRARRCTRKDHIFHARAAHRFCAAFAHDPTDRFQQVGFAATIRPDDTRQPIFDPQFGGLDKAFEADKFQLLYPHRAAPVANEAMSVPPRAMLSARQPRSAWSSPGSTNWRPALPR